MLTLYLFCIRRLCKSYDNECKKNVNHIPRYVQKMNKLYKTCTKFRLKTA